MILLQVRALHLHLENNLRESFFWWVGNFTEALGKGCGSFAVGVLDPVQTPYFT